MAFFKKKQTRDESYYMASQWTLMWRKLQKHKLARFSLVILAILYIGALFADFFAPYGLEEFSSLYKDTAPTKIYWQDEEGNFSRPWMYGNALHVVAQQRAVFCGEVMQHLLSVGTYQISTIRLCAYPFSVGCIDGNARDGDVVEEIVGQPAAVVAVYLDLCKVEVFVEYFRYIFYDEQSGRRAYPHHSVEIFAEAEELVGQIGCVVLVDEVLQQPCFVVGGAFCAFHVDAEDATFVESSAGDKFDAAAVMQNLVDE